MPGIHLEPAPRWLRNTWERRRLTSTSSSCWIRWTWCQRGSLKDGWRFFLRRWVWLQCQLVDDFSLLLQVPTIAFHASLNHPFGKGALINLFRQLAKVFVCKISTSLFVQHLITVAFRFTQLLSKYPLVSLGIQTQVHLFYNILPIMHFFPTQKMRFSRWWGRCQTTRRMTRLSSTNS